MRRLNRRRRLRIENRDHFFHFWRRYQCESSREARTAEHVTRTRGVQGSEQSVITRHFKARNLPPRKHASNVGRHRKSQTCPPSPSASAGPSRRPPRAPPGPPADALPRKSRRLRCPSGTRPCAAWFRTLPPAWTWAAASTSTWTCAVASFRWTPPRPCARPSTCVPHHPTPSPSQSFPGRRFAAILSTWRTAL